MKLFLECSNCEISYNINWSYQSTHRHNELISAVEDEEEFIAHEELWPNLCPFCGQTSDEIHT